MQPENKRKMSMKPSETRKHIDEIESMHGYDGRYKTIYALVCSLPDKELMQYVETHGFPSYYMRLVARRGLERAFAARQKNTVSRMLKQLSLPDCKNKTQLRERLKQRYPHVPLSYRQRILRCMLTQGTKKERLWVYTRLGWQWDDSFAHAIEQCLAEYHEVECAYLILDHFPTAFVYERREEFAQMVGWRRVMSSVGKDYPDIIDRERLSPLEWLQVVVDLHLTEHRGDIEDYLYHKITSVTDSIMSGVYHQDCPQSLRDLPDVNWTVWAMGQMGMSEAILRFQAFDRKFETYVPEDIDDEKRAETVYPWLCDVYDTFAVGMLGWPTREEKGYSLEQYREARHVFIYGEEGVDSIGGWLVPPVDGSVSGTVKEDFPF